MNNQLAHRESNSQVSRLYDDPFQSLEQRMNQFFRSVFDSDRMSQGLGNYPVDVDEDDDQITIEAEMPGFKRDEIEINVENGVLTISAERGGKTEGDAKRKRHVSERKFTRIQRSFSLPRSVDGSDVEATLDSGVLHLTLKKTEESKPRRIEIQSAE